MTYTSITKPASGATASKANFADLVCDNFDDHEARLASAETGKVPTSRLVSTGSGLTGGGDLTADRTLEVSYGTTSNTVTRGNDSRVTITQDATQGNAALHTRASALETIRDTRGRWYYSVTSGNFTSGQDIPYDTVDGDAPAALVMSSGKVTVVNAGDYTATATCSGRAASAGLLTLALVVVTGGNTYYVGGNTQYVNAATDFLLPCSMEDVKLASSATIAVNLSWATISSVARTPTGWNSATYRSTNFGVRRVR